MQPCIMTSLLNEREIIIMAYVTNEFTKKIRTQLKKEFPNIKFSVTKRHHMELCVAIMESKEIDFSNDCKNSEGGFENYRSVNYYHVKGNYNNEKILQEIIDICMADHWDDSDVMTDYVNCSYYFDLSIGKWDKPFKYLGK